MRHFIFTIAAALILSAAVNAGAQNPDYETYFTHVPGPGPMHP